MTTPRAELTQARTLVVKIGSGVLVRNGTHFDRGTFCRVVEQIAGLVESGHQLIVVSSGAVALGRGRLGGERPDRVRSLPRMQALAAVGQTALMQLYDAELDHYGIRCGQVLLTREDLDDRSRYLNARRTLRALVDMRVVPIINENDTVATHEMQFGDNDQLAARVACLLEADLLVVLSDVDAIYTGDPNEDPEAVPLDVVNAGDPELETYVGGTRKRVGGVGTGGMVTKLEAARIAGKRGIPTLILGGKQPHRLPRALAGQRVGTLLVPSEERQRGRKAWIESLRVQGRVYCDSGAVRAVREHGKSLLPSGITKVEGRFVEGDAVELCDDTGVRFARGLAIYPSVDMRRLQGRQSHEIEPTLGYHVSDVIVHRDDLVVLPANHAEAADLKSDDEDTPSG